MSKKYETAETMTYSVIEILLLINQCFHKLCPNNVVLIQEFAIIIRKIKQIVNLTTSKFVQILFE